MKREVISEAISNIDENYIEEADLFQVNKTKISLWRKWIPMAACLCIIAVGAITLGLFKIAHPWPVKFVRLPGSPGVEVPLIAEEIPPWETRPIYSQYSSVEWNGITYYSRSAEIPVQRIGELLGEVTAIGHDSYTESIGQDGERRISARVYAVTGISSDCVLAVQYEGTDTWYALRNSYYKPESLGQFIEDYNVYEEVVFDTIHYSFTNSFGDYISIRFENVDDQIIRDWLLTALDSPDLSEELELYQWPRSIMGISVDVPILDIENISLSILEDGYISTNVVPTGALFYIGEEKTQGFVDYVLKECDGYETIYIYEEPAIPENWRIQNGQEKEGQHGEPDGGSEGAASPSMTHTN